MASTLYLTETITSCKFSIFLNSTSHYISVIFCKKKLANHTLLSNSVQFIIPTYKSPFKLMCVYGCHWSLPPNNSIEPSRNVYFVLNIDEWENAHKMRMPMNTVVTYYVRCTFLK